MAEVFVIIRIESCVLEEFLFIFCLFLPAKSPDEWKHPKLYIFLWSQLMK